ncbi:hypothetical protein H5407_12210 [Mitsuaria sp. WAJ17]|uniref:DUF6600 domain-containing protein n=1 Tax=Mitsuaria sp. WAJ17 TaxID=2761452 RepID=UPI0015FFE0E5|nr:DUF6600 domain-containing protein [Mitsuaria sp. WAJ17]MBB2485985.1 hypothetical protein [Mitsuaria sp. WAJ17]
MTMRHLQGASLPRPLTRAFASALVLASCLWALPAQAEDPPTRAARVAETQGTAWVFDAETKDWQRLGPNQTLGQGDRIRTERDGRLALRVGSTSLWLDDSADLELSRLDEDHLELLLARGQLGLRLRNAEAARELQVRTREGRFLFDRKGLYRVDQLDRGSRAFNWEGELRFEARAPGTPAVWLQPNEQAEFWWADGPRVERQVLERDRFADWLLGMSRSEGDLPAYRYVSPEMTGAEDLDRYGRWEQAAEYGTVWIPQQVAPDWAPYRYGRWVWTRHWGWSWVDDAPWGFAPFHYGRWVMVRERWCWVPGRYVPRPAYAPALVAWVGGPVVSVGISIGSRPPRYGWYPLAPREVYVPSYHHSPHYGQRINREHDPVTVVHPGSALPPPRSNREVRGAVSIWSDAAARAVANTDANVPLRVLPQAPSRQEWRPQEARGDAGVPLRGLVPQAPVVQTAPVLPGHPAAQDPVPVRRDNPRGRGDREEGGVPLRAVPQPQASQPAVQPPVHSQVQPQIQPQIQPPIPPTATPPAPSRSREDGPPLRRLPEQPVRPESRETAVPQVQPDRGLQERMERDRLERERVDRERMVERDRQERQDRQDRVERAERQQRFEQQQRDQMQHEQAQREQVQREQQQREQQRREQMQREQQQREVPMRQIQPERAREPVRGPEPPRVSPPQRQEEARPGRPAQQDNVPRKGRQEER